MAKRMMTMPRGGPRPGSGPKPNSKDKQKRQIHSIRFSPGEWKTIRKRAATQGIPAAEYVRKKALEEDEEKMK